MKRLAWLGLGWFLAAALPAAAEVSEVSISQHPGIGYLTGPDVARRLPGNSPAHADQH